MTTHDHTIIDSRRYDMFSRGNGRYGTTLLTIDKSTPRMQPVLGMNVAPLSDIKNLALTSRVKRRRISTTSMYFEKTTADKSIGNDDSGRKIIYSRHLSCTASVLSIGEETQKKIIYNWSGLYQIARETQLARPENVNELIRLVQTALSKVAVMGTGLTFEKLMSIQLDDPEAKLISMKAFQGLIEMKKETAVFGAATPVNDVIAILTSYNRMLPCSPGSVGIQTLAGAIATGTHGQGMHQASYSDIVKSLQVVLPNGKVVTIDEHTVDYPLQAFVTAMGTLGITLQIEIAHVPRRIFYCRKFACKIDDMLSNYSKWNNESEYVKVWWFSETGFCHVWIIDALDKKQCQQSLNTPGDASLEYKYENHSINDTINEYIQSMAADTKVAAESSESQFEMLRRFTNTEDITGYSEQILCKGIPVPQVNCEIAIPFERVRDATLAIQAWASEHRNHLHYPFIYRATGQSKAWLNPSYNGAVCYIGFLVYVAKDGTVRNDGMTTMRELQTILAPFGGIPHWGKHFQPDIYDFQRLIPKWKDFLSLRARLDPKKKMLSTFLENIFRSTGIDNDV